MNGQPVTLESFMQEAVKALRQVEVSPGTSEAQPSNSTSSPETSVLHVQSLEVGDGGELLALVALELISRLEERKLAEIEQLKRHTEEGRDRIRQARIALEKSWWEHLMDYARDGVSCSGDAAVANAPFFTDVPRCALRGLVPSGDAGDESLWDMLRSALPNLNRRRRKALQQSRHWIVHLFAGPRPHKTFARLERDGTVVLELDVTQCAAHDLNRLSLWALLLKAAKDGRIAAVIGGPPCRTMSVLRHKPGGPRPVRSPSEPYGLSDLSASERALVNNDTGLFARMLFSHATATAGRRVHRQSVHHSSQVAFLLEQPQPVDRYLPVGHSLVGEVPSFWHTNLWRAYALEAGLFEVDFDQGALGHATTKPTTIGTNLPDLRGLHGLRKECPTLAWKGDSKDLAAWAPQFVQAVVHALQCWPLYQLCRMTPEDWQRHVENNHVPYRRDCGVCVRGAGTGRRHQGVTHPDVYCLSADVAGPIRVPAKDPEGRSKHPPVFRYFLAASYRFPKLGTKDEPNPTQVDGFDDPLLHPGGEDKLADVVVEGPLEPEHRPDGKDVLPEDCLGYCPTSESENDACKEAGALRVAAAKAKAKPSKPKEEHPWERAKCEFEAPPGLARLVFVVPLHTNKSEAVLEALQQVFLELRSLNLPVLRFHSDRSREFFNKRTRAWFHEHGVRTTTAEGDTPQQNGAAENTIRWLKARARTLLAQAEVGTELWACAMATAASQQRAQQLGLKSKLAAPFGAPCSVKLKFYGPSRGDLGDRWVDGKYMGLSPSVNDGHIVLRNDGVGNGFLQTLHVRSRLHSPEMPDRVFEGDVREPAPLEPARRVRGKSEPALGEPPLPPPPLPPPEGECVPAPASRTRLRGKSSPAVSKSLLFPLPDGECPPEQCEAVEEEFRASRFSVVDLEGFAQELLLEDWDLEEAMWVLVQFSRLQSLKAGLYRHGGVVGTTSATNSHPWLTELMAATLLSASPEAEFTSLWLSNTNPMSLHADHNNVEGSVNVVFPLKLPPEGGDLWVELRAGDVIHGSVEQRVDGTGKKWLGTTHSLQRGKPFYLDPKRRHATTPFEGERVVLVAYTVNTLGKVPESELQALESLGFPLPASARLPLTTQQDVRRLDVFDMFEEGPLELAGEDCPKKVEKGGGWKETQKVEAGTVELEVSWNLKHTPVQHEQTPCGLQTLEPKPHAQVEEESWPEQPVQWELWLPDPQSGQQLCALRSDGLDLRLCKSEPVYTPDIEQLLSGLTEPLQIVHTVDPREAEKHGEVWIPSILSERDRGHRKSCAPFAA
ncbi:GIP [Symbiodinium natans]|uniref:GIP protein n=1 Tax=Symbiodinium natans TaxID=878477 RepID=A0A812KNW9_9DINO|nr:GIP [Symbiodinium natans]